MVDIWSEVSGPLMATIFRFVDSQEQAATFSLVNNVYEQGVLELLESTKNPLPEKTASLHYLLKTPFRYPPLKHGSRFGTTFESGIFYGSLNLSSALAETAYYRFVYMLAPEVPFQQIIASEYSAFSVSVKSNLGIYLDEPPFTKFESILMSPTAYTETQQLGSTMRQQGVEIFRYVSARDKNKGKNVALFSPNAFCSLKPSKLISWLCQTSVEEVGFLSKENSERVLFMQKDFWVNGVFPSPAM